MLSWLDFDFARLINSILSMCTAYDRLKSSFADNIEFSCCVHVVGVNFKVDPQVRYNCKLATFSSMVSGKDSIALCFSELYG
jgi:hypothetical protein